MTTSASTQTTPPGTITVSSIIAMLEGGKTRDQIREELHLTQSELKTIFDHPQLKGRKTHTSRSTRFILVDDVTGTPAAQTPHVHQSRPHTEEPAAPVTGRGRTRAAAPAPAIEDTTPASPTSSTEGETANEAPAAPAQAEAEIAHVEEVPQRDDEDNLWS